MQAGPKIFFGGEGWGRGRLRREYLLQLRLPPSDYRFLLSLFFPYFACYSIPLCTYGTPKGELNRRFGEICLEMALPSTSDRGNEIFRMFFVDFIYITSGQSAWSDPPWAILTINLPFVRLGPVRLSLCNSGLDQLGLYPNAPAVGPM